MLTELHQVGWTRGPVLQYEHDERERDYLAISTLAGTANVLEVGDALNNYEYEPCAFINKFNDKAVFVEFVVPGPCETTWFSGKILLLAANWGRRRGHKPCREISYRAHGEDDGL